MFNPPYPFDESAESADLPGDPYASPGEPAVAARPQRAATSPIAPIRQQPPLLAARRTVLKSQLVSYTGPVAVLPSLVARLNSQLPVFWIVNRPALPPDLELSIEAPGYLLNWYPREVLAQAGAFLAPPDCGVDFSSLALQLWGRDCLFAVGSPLEYGALLKHLQAAIRGDDGESTDPPRQVLMYYTPAGVRSLLSLGAADLLAPLLAGAPAVLVEAEDPAEWMLFCGPALDPQVRPWFANA